MVKVLPTGDLDPSFGDNGISYELLPYNVHPRAITVRPQSDELVMACRRASGFDPFGEALVAQMLATGHLDPGFGTGGLSAAAPCSAIWVNDIQLMPDGGVAVGIQGQGAPFESWNFLLAGFDMLGQVDLGFGSDGLIETDLDESQNPPYGSGDDLWGLTIQEDGKLLGTGPCSNTFGRQSLGITRYAGQMAMSVDNTTSGTGIICFPNPATDHIMVSLKAIGFIPKEILLIDPVGRMVPIIAPEPDHEGFFRIPITRSIASGSYVLSFVSDHHRSMVPVMIGRP